MCCKVSKVVKYLLSVAVLISPLMVIGAPLQGSERLGDKAGFDLSPVQNFAESNKKAVIFEKQNIVYDEDGLVDKPMDDDSGPRVEEV